MTPTEAAPNAGQIILNAELPALCSAGAVRIGRAGDTEAGALSQRLRDVLLRPEVLDLAQLGISSSQAAW